MNWSRSTWVLFAAILIVLAPGVSAHEGEDCLLDAAQYGVERATVLDPELDAGARQTALKRIIARAADEDHGSAAYLLGALFRLGEAHPSALVERDPETARFWFERCIAVDGCPVRVFAALAELELIEDRPREALIYTHVYLNLLRIGEGGDPSFYDVSLLNRALARHGRVDADRLQAGIDDYVAGHDQDLQRILEGIRKPYGVGCDGALEVGYDGGASKRPGRAQTRAGVNAWYLASVTQEPGYPDKTLLYDALPDAEQARGLERTVRTLRVKASVAPPVGDRWWFIVPVSVTAAGSRPVLFPSKPPAGRDDAGSDVRGDGSDE